MSAAETRASKSTKKKKVVAKHMMTKSAPEIEEVAAVVETVENPKAQAKSKNIMAIVPHIFHKLASLLAIKISVSTIFKPILLVIYFVLLLFVAYHLLYAHCIIPGVRIGNVRVGGMTTGEAQKALQGLNAQNEQLTLVHQEQTFTITGADINLTYDWDASIARAFEVGRSGNFIKDTKDKLAGLIKQLQISAYYDYNDEALSNKFSEIKAEVNVDAADASFALKDGDLTILPSAEGHKIVDDALYNSVMTALNTVNFSAINLPLKTVKPKIYDTNLQSLQSTAEKIIKNKLTITHDTNQWVLTPEQLLDMVTVAKTKTGQVQLLVNEPKFEAFSDSIAAEVAELPRGQVTSTDGDKVTDFEITQDGKALNDKQFADDFKQALFDAKPTLDLPMIAVSGPASKEKYGILELLGEGTSHFKGSASSRIHNLTLAAERTNGVLVAPGATYSLNKSVGEISAKTGYDTAYIIAEGRTVLGEGGGVCQTSTTLFRAVLNSGLPVVMRYPHAYRVGYYEQDMPVGFDAAIFQPSWDFQFKNDTSAYVLVQSSYNPDEYSLTFKLYGTSDGRKVEIPKPTITGETPPPPALYQDDPTLPKGVVKQVDFAAWGATVKLTRKVTRGDEVLYDDTFNSRYQPWRAVYLVGTK